MTKLLRINMCEECYFCEEFYCNYLERILIETSSIPLDCPLEEEEETETS